MNLALIQNSLLVAGATALLATSLGFAAALWLAGLKRGWQMLFLAGALAGLALPPFLVTNCWLHFLGHAGVWQRWLPVNLFSVGGTVWILTLLLWPIPLLFAWSAWQRLEPAQLEADPAVRGWAFMQALLWPIARPALVQAAVLTFVLALGNFAVPAILQVKVFPAEMWVRFNTSFDTAGALGMSWPLMVGPLVLLWWLSRRPVPWPHLQAPVTPGLFRRQLGCLGHGFAGMFAVMLLALTIALPLFQLAMTERTWRELPGALAAGSGALWHSFCFAALTATAVIGLSVAGWVTGTRAKSRRSFRTRKLAGWALWFPFLMPGVLLGIGLIVVFNRPSLSFIYQGAAIVLLALLIRYLAVGWHTVGHACERTDRDLVDAAAMEGANRWQMGRHVYWPQIAPQAAVAWYVVYLLCLWDVESMVLIMPPGGETLALRIFNLLHYGHNAQVNALCLALLGLAVTPLFMWQLARRWRVLRVVMSGTWCLCALTGCDSGGSANLAPVRSQLFDQVQIVATRGAGAGQVNKPRSVAIDGRDHVFVVDMTGRVQKFSPEGVFQLQWQMPETDIGRPKGMCRDTAGNVVVVEPHYARVNHFFPNGNLTFQWGQRGTNGGQIGFPRAVAVNRHGEIYVTEYSATERVQRFQLHPPGATNTVQFLSAFGRMGSEHGEFNRPEGICVDTLDRVYVADSCNHRIQVFTREGEFIKAYGKAGSGPGEMSYPYDICIDAAGRQYVCEFGSSRIQVFDANHEPLEIIGGPGAEPGRFSNPWGVALDSEENLYVADSQNHRVQKFLRKPGTRITGARGSSPVAQSGFGSGGERL